MKIGITGSNGFIGQNLVNYLKKNNINFIEIDVLNIDHFYDKHISHIIHLAGKTSVQQSWSDVPLFLDSNITLTARILELSLKIGATVTLFSSYGYHSSDGADVHSPYHLTKAFSEQLAFFYYQKFKLPITILRLASVYGIGQKINGLLPTILQQILDPEIEEILVNNLSSKRSYIDVRDVVDFILLSLPKIYKFNIYYVGDNKLYSVEDVVKKSLKISGVNKAYRQRYCEANDSILFNIEKNHSNVNNFDWKLKYSLDNGIAYLIDHIREVALR
ncbi:MAG: NAD(P)-dependent oxidoreductase [Gammaproteobacteria bacterium]